MAAGPAATVAAAPMFPRYEKKAAGSFGRAWRGTSSKILEEHETLSKAQTTIAKDGPGAWAIPLPLLRLFSAARYPTLSATLTTGLARSSHWTVEKYQTGPKGL